MRLIDADELKTAFPTCDNSKSILIASVRATINHMPTIEELKTGQWEEREVLSEKVIDEWQSARCSVCGRYHTTPYMYYFDEYNYCPNCGSKMKKPMTIPEEVINSVLGYDD